MTTSQPCPCTRRVPIESIKPAPPEWKGTYARRYGLAHCLVCRCGFTAHKDGTPVYHTSPKGRS